MQIMHSEPSPHIGERLKSCNQCRKNHTKCDGKLPCAYCSLRNTKCEYSFKKQRTQKPTKQELQLQSELLKLRSEYERLQYSEKYWKEKYHSATTTLQSVKSDTVVQDDLLVVYALIFELMKEGKIRCFLPTGVCCF